MSKIVEGAKLLAIQASPRREGFTNQLMNIVLEGAGEVEGVDIEEIFLPDRRLEFCRGCFSCKNPPHHCVLRDDMGENGDGMLHRSLEDANGIIFTLPTYLWSANALTHTFFERCYPFLWSQQLNGVPFAYVTSAYNSGMHRESARSVEKWAFICSLKLIGGFSVHFAHLEEDREDLRELGRRCAQASVDDLIGRKEISQEDRYAQTVNESWGLPDLYLDNITRGTGRKSDLLTTIGFERGWFKQPDAYPLLREADELFRQIIDNIDSGNSEEAMRLLSNAHRIWKDGTLIEYGRKP